MTETPFAKASLVLPDEILHGSLTTKVGLICDLAIGPAVPMGVLDLEGDLPISDVADGIPSTSNIVAALSKGELALSRRLPRP